MSEKEKEKEKYIRFGVEIAKRWTFYDITDYDSDYDPTVNIEYADDIINDMIAEALPMSIEEMDNVVETLWKTWEDD
jgi:hypothetical protein